MVNDRGWTTKTTVYKNGVRKDGVAWNKARLYDILVNVTYIGQVLHKGKLYPGEQDAIIDKRTFKAAQKLLQDNSQNGGADSKNKHNALLRGLLKCGNCGAAMTHTWAKKPPNRLYRYYTCSTRVKRGKDACPTPTLPAQEIEDFVVEQIRSLARYPELAKAVFKEACRQQKDVVAQLQVEKKRLQAQLQSLKKEAKRLVSATGVKDKPFSAITGRLAETEASVARIESRIGEIERDVSGLASGLSERDVLDKLADFNGVWSVMSPSEQLAIIQSLIEIIAFDKSGNISVQLKTNGRVH